MHLPENKKKLVYWGIGIKCWKCLTGHPECVPDAFLDSNYEDGVWRGKPVQKPLEYEDWQESFIVTTLRNEEECFEYLDSMGLKRGLDYSGSKEFFEYDEMTSEEMIEHAKTRVEYDPDLCGRLLLFGPIFASRVSDEMIKFFRAYAMENADEKFLLLTGLNVISEKRAEELIGFPVVNISCSDKKDQSDLKKHVKIMCDLFRPKAILIWGGWTEVTFFLVDLASERGLKYAHFEHGFIPGTIQCDREGIAGYGEIANHPDRFRKYPVSLPEEIFERLRCMIVDSGKDTGVFRAISSDREQLEKIDESRKTVFLVGSDCIHWDTKGGSEFWKQAVSEEIDSSEEAFLKTLEITRRNGWNLIYKPHPGNPDKFCDKELGADDVAIVKYASIDELLRRSDVVVTISTAVSYKTLFYSKPLVELGKSGFYGQGCSYEVHGDYEDKLKTALINGVTEAQMEHFKHHILTLLSFNHWDDLTHPDLPYGLPVTERFLDDRRKNI